MGIKKYGKNFQLIRDTFLTDYRTVSITISSFDIYKRYSKGTMINLLLQNEVVKFYYSWKHTSDAKNHTNAQGKRYAKVKRTRKHCPVVLVDENGMIPEKMMLRSAVRKARKARSRTSPLQKRASSRSAKQSHSKPVPKTPLAERATWCNARFLRLLISFSKIGKVKKKKNIEILFVCLKKNLDCDREGE